MQFQGTPFSEAQTRFTRTKVGFFSCPQTIRCRAKHSMSIAIGINTGISMNTGMSIGISLNTGMNTGISAGL